MASDQKSTDPAAPEKQKPDVITSPPKSLKELPPEVIGKRKEMTSAQKETAKGATGIKWEILKDEVENRDKISEKIRKLDVTREPENEEQQDAFKSLMIVTGTTLLAVLFKNGFSLDTLKNIKNLDHVFDSVKNLNEPERAAASKLKEIFALPSSPFYPHNWPEFVAESYQLYRTSMKVGDTLFKAPVSSEKPNPKEKDEEGLLTKTLNWAENNKLKAAAMLGIAGVCGYMVYDFFSDSSSNEKEDSFFDGKIWKMLKISGGIGAVLFVLGRFTSPKEIAGWLNINEQSVEQAWELFKKGEIKKGLALLWEGPDENFEHYQKLAEIISKANNQKVEAETLKVVANIRYADFISPLEEGKSALAGELEKSDWVSKIPGGRLAAEKFLGSREQIAQEKVIRDYLKINQSSIEQLMEGPSAPLGSNATVFEVLLKLNNIDLPRQQKKPEIAPAASVAAVGAVGRTAKEEAEKAQGSLEKDAEKILASLGQKNSLDEDSKIKINEDMEKFSELMGKVETTNKSWWASEKEYWRQFMNNVPDSSHDDQDMLEFIEELDGNDKAILADLRQQASGLVQRLKEIKPGERLSKEETQNLQDEISAFYRNNKNLQAKLDEINQKRIHEQEERNRQLRDKNWFLQKNWFAGVELTAHTLFGIPLSVFIKREENGKIVTMIAYASAITSVVGTSRFLVKGQPLKAFAYGAWELSRPVRFLTYEGFSLSKKGIEYLHFLHTRSSFSQVQKGTLTIAQGIKRIEDYLYTYGWRTESGNIVKQEAAKGIRQKIASFGRSRVLTEDNRKVLETGLKRLYDLKKAGCETWEQAIAKGLAEPPPTLNQTLVPSFNKQEEELIAKKIAELEKDPFLKPDPKKPYEKEALRQLAIEQLQKEGKLRSVEEMGNVLKDLLTKEKIEGLSPLDKIEKLREASKEADLYLEKAIAHIKEMRKQSKTEAEIQKFTQEVQQNLKALREKFQLPFKELKEAAKDMTSQEKRAFEVLLTQELSQAKGIRAVTKRVGQAMKGRAKFAIAFGVANIVLESYEASKNQKEAYTQQELIKIGKAIGWDTLQIIVDVLSPFGVSDWYTVFSGQEAITGKEATTWNRVTRGVFGTYNLVTDVLAVIGAGASAEAGGAGGAAIYGAENAIELPLRAAGKTPEVIKAAKEVMPRLMLLAKDVGGFKNLWKIVSTEKFIKALQSTQKVAGIGMAGVLAVDVAKLSFAGYEIFFDTKDQPEFELDLGSEVGMDKAA
jgi:hypothetical protein